MLTQADVDNIVHVIFFQKHICTLWTNIAEVIFVCNVVSHVFGQLDKTIFLYHVVPVWLIQHLGYFHHKSCLLDMGQHCTGNNNLV